GSVNSIQLAEALTAKGFNIDRKNISLPDDAIKEIGDYEATIKLHKKVSKTVKFSVVSE
ncbi:MAG: 50S ribosomal protein L9, partial [Flavobacteriales bacterium]|nr:50S ribosomal protein L9 [Flavobacteriales bacterium]